MRCRPRTYIPLAFPSDITPARLPLPESLSWPARRQSMIDYLEHRAPCIYVTSYDWNHACVAPELSARVGVVGVLHSDEKAYYEHLTGMGRYWNGAVAVSRAIEDRARGRSSVSPERLHYIPYGVEVPDCLPSRS